MAAGYAERSGFGNRPSAYRGGRRDRHWRYPSTMICSKIQRLMTARHHHRAGDRLKVRDSQMELEAVVHILGLILGWPLRRFRLWLDRQPDRPPAQISLLHKLARLALGIVASLCILVPLGWAIWR